MTIHRNHRPYYSQNLDNILFYNLCSQHVLVIWLEYIMRDH